MKRFVLYGIFLLSINSCVEKFDLELDNIEPRLVVEGLIDNQQGPYYIRLTKSNTGSGVFNNQEDDYYSESFEIVEDAMVIVSDDEGQKDTLQVIPKSDLADSFSNGGYYKTSSFIGKAGHTYFLKVITSDGKVYTASDYMIEAPNIEDVSYEKRVSEKDGQEYYVPILSFIEPHENKNYYLIQNSAEFLQRATPYTIYRWNFEVISDDNLKSGLISIFLDNGASPQDHGFYYYSQGNDIYVKMSSITLQSYNFYKAVLEQFKQDGGVYKPTPASPPSNINNGGLGFFQASAIVNAHTKIDVNENI